MATHSTRQRKLAKPSSDFPLFSHRSGGWCKKIRRRFCYFGKVTDKPDFGAVAELATYQEQAVDQHAGRVPRTDNENLQSEPEEEALSDWSGAQLSLDRTVPVDLVFPPCAGIHGLPGVSHFFRLPVSVQPVHGAMAGEHMTPRWGADESGYLGRVRR